MRTLILALFIFIGCEDPQRTWRWCMVKGNQCYYSKKDYRLLQDKDWVLTPHERLAIESYILILEEEAHDRQEHK